ncbi:MAG: hypothetical protein ACR2NU_13305 [Aeoliella sp.]
MQSPAEKLGAANAAIEAGNNLKALELLNELVDSHPSAWAYGARARLHLEMGDDIAALADCEAGLEIAPDHREMTWMATELKKPAGRRFQGRFANPPDKGEG